MYKVFCDLKREGLLEYEKKMGKQAVKVNPFKMIGDDDFKGFYVADKDVWAFRDYLESINMEYSHEHIEDKK